MIPDMTHDAAAEAVALFRMQVLGGLTRRTLARGELRQALRKISAETYIVPGIDRRQRFSVTTLERWYYALRRFGLPGLKPRVRTDRGRARALNEAQKKLVVDIRCQHPSASATLILKTLQQEGRIDDDAISAATLRRYFAQECVQKTMSTRNERAPRLRWQAESPGTLFHADVCHGPKIRIDGRMMPTRIHALLDDASRYIVAVRVSHTEKEADMLALLVQAWRAWGISDLLYLDNGATYRGQVMATACGRIGTTLLHAKPYDPRARGKMERFWRTLRAGCLDYLNEDCDLETVHARVQHFVAHNYHDNPRASLMGKSSAAFWAQRKLRSVTEQQIADALTVHHQRKINGDGTVSIGGVLWETMQHFLANKKVNVGRTLLQFNTPPWVEYDKKKYTLRRADPIANGKPRACPAPKRPTGIDVLFDPTQPMLDFSPTEHGGTA